MNAKEFLILNRPDRGLEIHIGVDVTDYRTEWHFHQEWQIVQVLSGSRAFEWRSGAVVVSAGQTLVIPPGCVHRGHGGRASFRMFYVAAGDPIPNVPTCTSPRRFRQLTGVSPRGYRVQVRLLEARRRLLRGQRISAIAMDLGFADQSHLGRHFKRAFGLTPAQFVHRTVETRAGRAIGR
jgi:hypothetical protein